MKGRVRISSSCFQRSASVADAASAAGIDPGRRGVAIALDGEVVLLGAVDQGVLIHPAHARGIGAELRLDAFGQLAAHLRQVLQHP